MNLLFRSMWGAFGTFIFVALVSSGCLGFLAIPAVGSQFGPLVCDDGETMTYETYSWSNGGESGTSVDYYCDNGAGEPREVGFFELLLAGAAVWYAFVFVIVWPWGVIARLRKGRRKQRLEQHGVPAVIRILQVSQTNVRINDRPLLSIEMEVHPETMSPYQMTKQLAVSEIMIPQLQPGNTLSGIVDPEDPENIDIPLNQISVTGTMGMATSGSNSVQRLKELKKMMEEGLITPEEYEEKKDEILSRL